MSYPIEHRPIRQFIAAVEHGNITSASLALNISQPAQTKSNMKLECLIGVKLLKRHDRGVVTSSYGDILL